MQKNKQSQPKDQRNRQYTYSESLNVTEDMMHISDSLAFRTTLTYVYGVCKARDSVNIKNNKLNTKTNNSKPFAPIAIKTETQPKHSTTNYKLKSIKTKPNDFWYKGKKYPLNKREYLLAECIYQFMFQNGETSWN